MRELTLLPFKWEPLAVQVLWEAYEGGSFTRFERDLSVAEFKLALVETMSQYSGFHIILDGHNPLAFIFSKYNGWILEPHVEIFPGHSARTILQGYRLFFNAVINDHGIQACLIRSREDTKPLFDKFCSEGILQDLKDLPPSMGSEDEYQYVIIKTFH